MSRENRAMRGGKQNQKKILCHVRVTVSACLSPPHLHCICISPLVLTNQSLKPQTFRNPYDIPRSHLLDQLSRMRRNLLNTSVCNLRGQDSGKSQPLR